MKNKILKSISKSPKTFNQLLKELKLNSFSDKKNLDKLLRELWGERKIFYKKTNETYNIKNDEEIVGIYRETKNDYGFVENDDITVFIPGQFVLNAMDGDSVKVILFSLREDDDPKKRSGKIVRVMQRNGASIIGRVEVNKNKKVFVPDELLSKREYSVDGIEEFDDGDILLTKFIDFNDGIVKLKIKRKIGSTENAKLDPEVIGLKFDLKTRFSKSVLDEAKNIEAKDSKRRVDITDRLIYTIDGIESKDLDDAIDIIKLKNGNYRLGVHIADVSHFVKQGDKIDLEAEERGTSVYLIDKVFPMLPKKLSNDLCSLNPNTLKFALTCDMEIDKSGKVIKTNVFESKIISKHRLTYEQVDTLFENKVDTLISEELTNSLLLAKELSSILRKVKIDGGMIDFVLPEGKVKLDEEGEVIQIKNKYQTSSEKVIEDLMVITNESIAKLLSNKKLPGIFRVHPIPKEENLVNFSNLAKSLGAFLPKEPSKIKSKDLMKFLEDNSSNENAEILKRYMIQSMEKAIYSAENNGHYALGIKNYLHFTSPIRRYPDLIIHRLIKEFFIDKNYKDNIKNASSKINYLEAISKTTSEAERIAVSAERKIVDIKKSRYMKKFIGNNMEGKIVSVVKFGFFVEFENLTQGLVHITTLNDDEYSYIDEKNLILGSKNKKEFKLGQKVNVKIINVDVIRGLVDLEAI